ncbi:MAG: sulfurtransferase [Bacteroidetes bacterium]|nr:sulfurtransferase [Bacteroidota bacterium]
MNKFFLCCTALALLFTPAAAERSIPMFVSTQWLSDHLNDKDVVILQVGFSRNEYKYAHLPNARFVWFNSLAVSNPDLNTEMPSIEEGMKVLEELGIEQRSKIVVVFAGQNVTTTTRIILALSYLGFADQTALLDGGLDLWKSEGRPVSKEMPAVKRSLLKISADPSVITDADWVKAHLSSADVTIVDARGKNFYDGNGGGVARQGHITGAKSIPYTLMLDSLNRFRPAVELQQLFDDAGIKNNSTIVTYCHVGQQATVVAFVAKLLGYTVKVYDGSFEDWNVRDESYPVEKKEEVKK